MPKEKKKPMIKETKVRMPAALHKKLEYMSVAEGISMNEIAVQAIRAWKNEWVKERQESGEGLPWKSEPASQPPKPKLVPTKSSKKKPSGKSL
jgi:hypothetical protein